MGFILFALIIFDLLRYWKILLDISAMERDVETLYDDYSKLLHQSLEFNIKGENKNA